MMMIMMMIVREGERGSDVTRQEKDKGGGGMRMCKPVLRNIIQMYEFFNKNLLQQVWIHENKKKFRISDASYSTAYTSGIILSVEQCNVNFTQQKKKKKKFIFTQYLSSLHYVDCRARTVIFKHNGLHAHINDKKHMLACSYRHTHCLCSVMWGQVVYWGEAYSCSYLITIISMMTSHCLRKKKTLPRSQ